MVILWSLVHGSAASQARPADAWSHWASTVVGASRAHCLPAVTALKIARIANFGLAEAPFTAHQPVHRLGLLQVVLHFGERLDLWSGVGS